MLFYGIKQHFKIFAEVKTNYDRSVFFYVQNEFSIPISMRIRTRQMENLNFNDTGTIGKSNKLPKGYIMDAI